MAEEILKRNLDRAFDPGPDFPHRLLLSRTMATLDLSSAVGGQSVRAGLRDRRWQLWSRPSMRLVALAMVAIIAVAATAAFLALHRVSAPVPVHAPPFKVNAPGVGVCYGTCYVSDPLFVSSSIGLLVESTSSSSCDTTCPPQTSVLFRTDDGGGHWKAQHSWKPNDQIGSLIASPDAKELLIVGQQTDTATTFLYSGDGGISWTLHGLPPGAGQAAASSCKGGQCQQGKLPPQVYFLNPREGWVFSQEQSISVGDLFHTTDAGAHWTRLARIDVKAVFNIDVVAGVTYSNTYFTHSLPGQFVFQNTMSGWFITTYGTSGGTPPFLYRTVDGGVTWNLRSIPTVRGMTSAGFVSKFIFFNPNEAVMEFDRSFTAPGTTYASTTRDGGSHWSEPIKLSTEASLTFVDASNWVGWPYTGGWMTTADAGQHWNTTPNAASFGGPPVVNAGLPPSFPGRWVYFRSPAVGWAYVAEDAPGGGSSGVALYQTVDGGVSWTPLSLPELE